MCRIKAGAEESDGLKFVSVLLLSINGSGCCEKER